MIEVICKYYNRCKKRNSTNDYFVYPYFLVKGHANNGTSKECIQVCAGVSACVTGLLRLIDTTQYSIIFKSGHFEIKVQRSIENGYIDEDTNYALNTLLCQLYDLYKTYPNQFSRFDMIEVKENEENYEREPKPKPFRKLKEERKRMGLCSD